MSSHWPHSARVIRWQKCVTSTCFDGIVYWAEDGNGVGYIYRHMPRTRDSAQQHGASADTEIRVAEVASFS